MTAIASERSVAKTSVEAEIRRPSGSSASTQSGTSPSSMTRHRVLTNTTTSSSERFESALVMLVALTSRLSTSPVAGLSLSAVPASRVVLSVSSGVRFT